MLIALVGPNAVGKSYFIKHAMDDIADATPYAKHMVLHIVAADNTSDFELDDNQWLLHKDKATWQGSKADKIKQIIHMMEDKDEMWVVESARYIIGMNDIINPEFYRLGGGFRLVITTCTATTLKKFLIDRNEKNGHEFNEVYWTDRQLLYDCIRNDNMYATHYRPNGIVGRSIHIGYDRTEYDTLVLPLLLKWVAEPLGSWYAR